MQTWLPSANARRCGGSEDGRLPGFPEISPVTLDPSRSELARVRRSTVFWHVDGVTDDIPQKATLLTARAVSEGEGDTEFANTYAAYDALPQSRKPNWPSTEWFTVWRPHNH